MSTVNTMADVQTGREVVPSEVLPSQRSEIKFTAAQIEQDCPPQLQDLAKKLTEGLEKLYEQKTLVGDQEIAVKKLVTEIKALCDTGGFDAFRARFFPKLGKSRVYELLAIGTNKKSVEEVKASNRKRQAKHRANKLADLQVRYGNGHSEPVAEGALKETGEIEAPSIASQQTTEPAKPRSAVAPGDDALRWFDARVLHLDTTTEKRPPERFSKTAVPLEVLERLRNLFTDLVKLKRANVEATPVVVLRGTVSDEQPAEDTTAGRPVLDAEELRR